MVSVDTNGSAVLCWLLSSLVCTARKAHRNGIKKPRSQRYESLKGVRNVTDVQLQFSVDGCYDVLWEVRCAQHDVIVSMTRQKTVYMLVIRPPLPWACFGHIGDALFGSVQIICGSTKRTSGRDQIIFMEDISSASSNQFLRLFECNDYDAAPQVVFPNLLSGNMLLNCGLMLWVPCVPPLGLVRTVHACLEIIVVFININLVTKFLFETFFKLKIKKYWIIKCLFYASFRSGSF